MCVYTYMYIRIAYYLKLCYTTRSCIIRGTKNVLITIYIHLLWHCAMLCHGTIYCDILCYSIQYSILPWYVESSYVKMYGIILNQTMLHYCISYYIMLVALNYVMFWYAMLGYPMLNYAIPYDFISCRIILSYLTLY